MIITASHCMLVVMVLGVFVHGLVFLVRSSALAPKPVRHGRLVGPLPLPSPSSAGQPVKLTSSVSAAAPSTCTSATATAGCGVFGFTAQPVQGHRNRLPWVTCRREGFQQRWLYRVSRIDAGAHQAAFKLHLGAVHPCHAQRGPADTRDTRAAGHTRHLQFDLFHALLHSAKIIWLAATRQTYVLPPS